MVETRDSRLDRGARAMRASLAFAACVALAAALAGCGRRPAPGGGSSRAAGTVDSALVGAAGDSAGVVSGAARAGAEPRPHADQLLDAGNSAYRAGDYRVAARRYGAAAVVRPDDPAAYYGLGMALAKLGRDEDARAAYARARQLAQHR
jgi:Flp pilus assembly protein TadD